MSATPRTDRVCEVYHHSDNCEHLMIEHAQQLERELAVAVQEYRRLLRITLKAKEDANAHVDADADLKRQLKAINDREIKKLNEALLEGVAKTLNATVLRWVPVSEMLPAMHETVMVITRESNRPYGPVFKALEGWMFCRDSEYLTGTVTHWSPWPEVPEGLKGTK